MWGEAGDSFSSWRVTQAASVDVDRLITQFRENTKLTEQSGGDLCVFVIEWLQPAPPEAAAHMFVIAEIMALLALLQPEGHRRVNKCLILYRKKKMAG